MSTCPSSCPEIVPVEITQNILDLGDDVEEFDYEGVGAGSAAFDMGYEPVLVLVVSVGGAVQPASAYTISGTTITFDSAPGVGEDVYVKMLKEA